jgi:hypothetical protein
MNRISRIVACGLALLITVVCGKPIPDSMVPHYFQRNPFTRRDLSVVQVQMELGRLLSNGSNIFGPSDPRWDNATERWNIFSKPVTEVVVQPGEESDVSVIVRISPSTNVPFSNLTLGIDQVLQHK